MCCIYCFDDSPVEGDPHGMAPNQWKLSMMDTPCQETGTFLKALICCPCMAYVTRTKALDNDMSKYRCCQGYINCCCFKAGCLGEENCPECCLCLESWCCLGPAVSSTRMLVRDQFDLASDPCDNRIMRFNNCMQCLRCVCHILAIFDQSFRSAADLVDLIARIVFYTTQACITAQTHHELEYGAKAQIPMGVVMQSEKMER